MVKKSGFSLIELIIAIGLIAMLMLAISSSMLMSIISSNRIRNATKTKQAGNYALDQIQSIIRNAKDIQVCNSTTVTVVNQDGTTSTITFSNNRLTTNPGVYITPENITVSVTTLFECLPSVTTIDSVEKSNLIKVSYTMYDTVNPSGKENPVIGFDTSINLRNK